MSRLILKSPEEIAIMHEANRIIRETLRLLSDMIQPGMTTMEIDTFAEKRIRDAGGVPAFKGYPHRGDSRDFPGSVCASLNDEVVHGIPSRHVTLKAGDIISVDIGVLYKGFYGDGAATYPVGAIDEKAKSLLDVTRKALMVGIEQAAVGNRISDIGHAVQTHVEANGFSVVREFVGHGIGSQLHEDPQVPNLGPPGRRERLVEGMVLAIEPMVNVGGPEVYVDANDGWTARTRDSSLSAHFEACVDVTSKGPQVLGEQNGTLS